MASGDQSDFSRSVLGLRDVPEDVSSIAVDRREEIRRRYFRMLDRSDPARGASVRQATEELEGLLRAVIPGAGFPLVGEYADENPSFLLRSMLRVQVPSLGLSGEERAHLPQTLEERVDRFPNGVFFPDEGVWMRDTELFGALHALTSGMYLQSVLGSSVPFDTGIAGIAAADTVGAASAMALLTQNPETFDQGSRVRAVSRLASSVFNVYLPELGDDPEVRAWMVGGGRRLVNELVMRLRDQPGEEFYTSLLGAPPSAIANWFLPPGVSLPARATERLARVYGAHSLLEGEEVYKMACLDYLRSARESDGHRESWALRKLARFVLDEQLPVVWSPQEFYSLDEAPFRTLGIVGPGIALETMPKLEEAVIDAGVRVIDGFSRDAGYVYPPVLEYTHLLGEMAYTLSLGHRLDEGMDPMVADMERHLVGVMLGVDGWAGRIDPGGADALHARLAYDLGKAACRYSRDYLREHGDSARERALRAHAKPLLSRLRDLMMGGVRGDRLRQRVYGVPPLKVPDLAFD